MRYRLLILFTLLVTLAACGGEEAAKDPSIGPITISGGWARPTSAMAGGAMGDAALAPVNSAAYMTLTSSGEADRLISASSAVAAKVELHTVLDDGGMMAMRQVEAIDVPANGAVELKPGGFHVMLLDVQEPLEAGETLTLSLTFEKAGTVELTLPVRMPNQ